MGRAGESPLTPAASWHPANSNSGSGGGDDGSMEMQRSKSTLARLTRSVSKLGSRSKRSAAQQAGAPPPTLLAAPPPAAARATPGPGGGGRTGGGTGAASGRAGQLSVQDVAARIKAFEAGTFDVEADLGGLSEKGVERLRRELAQLDGEVAAGLKAAVREHYGDFVRATPGILRLEGELQQLRNLLHNMGDVVDGLAEMSAAVLAEAQQRPSPDAHQAAAAGADAVWRGAGEAAKWREALDDADVAVAERRLPEALTLLRRLEKLLQRCTAAADSGDPAQQARLDELGAEVEARRERLAGIVEQRVLQPTASPSDIRAGADLLARVAGRQQAHAAVLEAYEAKLRSQQAALLRPASSGGGDADGADYAAALGQKLAAALAAAADDVAAAFVGERAGGGGAGGPPQAELSAAFLVWALHQTERACHLLRKHALLPFAAPAGLHAAVRCAFAFAAHVAALEGSHGLQLVPTVLRELGPTLEQVLSRRLRKLADALRRAVGTEVAALAAGGAQPPGEAAAWEALAAAFPSADFLLDELEACAAACARLPAPRLGAALRRGAADAFRAYTSALAGALGRAQRAQGGEPEARERLAAAAEAAMELCTLLLERLLPDALAPAAEVWGDFCGSQAMADHLLRMGEALGMAAVPLTPGGSVALDATAAGAAAEGGEEGGGGGGGSAAGSRRASEASGGAGYRTTGSEE